MTACILLFEFEKRADFISPEKDGETNWLMFTVSLTPQRVCTLPDKRSVTSFRWKVRPGLPSGSTFVHALVFPGPQLRKPKNVQVALKVDVPKFWDMLFEAIERANAASPLNIK